MTKTHLPWGSWREAKFLTLALCLLLILLTGCDSTPSGASSSAGAAGVSGSAAISGTAGTGGSLGNTHGPTITFSSTTSIVVHLPNGSGGNSGTAGSGGTGGSAGLPTAQCVPDALTGTPPSIAVCGDGFRASTEDCDDRNTLGGDGCSPTCKITPQLVSPRVEALGTVTRINAGSGETFGEFRGDGFFSGGFDSSLDNVVSTDGVANAAPAEVYKSERWGDFTYTFSGLTPGAMYVVRLHFAEIYFDRFVRLTEYLGNVSNTTMENIEVFYVCLPIQCQKRLS